MDKKKQINAKSPLKPSQSPSNILNKILGIAFGSSFSFLSFSLSIAVNDVGFFVVWVLTIPLIIFILYKKHKTVTAYAMGSVYIVLLFIIVYLMLNLEPFNFGD